MTNFPVNADQHENAAPVGADARAVMGADYAWGRPSAAQLRDFGVQFVCRYLSHDDTGKNLTAPEATTLRAAGLAIVSNWEFAADAPLGGRAQGVADATAADAQHLSCSGPADRPIYFSVDFDATPEQQGAIDAYFDGIASVIGHARTGAYGGYWVVKRLLDAGKIAWAWQTYAWSGGQWDPRAQLRQVRNGVPIDSVDCDLDEAHAADYGQWGQGAVPPLPGPPAPGPVNDWTRALLNLLPTLGQGSTGQAVRIAQAELGAWGHPTPVDGDFGPATAGQVRAFQGRHGLTVDGVIGEHTHAVLKTGQDI